MGGLETQRRVLESLSLDRDKMQGTPGDNNGRTTPPLGSPPEHAGVTAPLLHPPSPKHQQPCLPGQPGFAAPKDTAHSGAGARAAPDTSQPHTSVGMGRTPASRSPSGRLTSASWAALLLSLVFASFQPTGSAEARSSNNSVLTTYSPDPEALDQCPNIDFCPQAALCCQAGVDEYGWIAAAVGWSLWFLTLILLCVNKLTRLSPEEPKDSQA